MLEHFQKFAEYNQWANTLLFSAIGDLSEKEFKQDLGAFFGTICNTLNHVLVGDLLWMERLEGDGPKPASLDTVLFENFKDLSAARAKTDQRLINLVNGQTPSGLKEYLNYENMSGSHCRDLKSEIFTHIFNHQTHHRGQCHHMLNQLGKTSPSIDMIYFFRNRT